MRNYLQEMLYALTSAYSRKDYENVKVGKPPETNIGKLFALFAWGLGIVSKSADRVKEWDDIDHAQGAVLDRYGANVGVERGAANDAVYRIFIKTKMLTQLSGGNDDYLIAMVAELLDTDYENIWLEDVFPAKKQLHIKRGNISAERLELLNQIGYSVKRAMAAGVGLPYMIVTLDEVLGISRIGGKVTDIGKTPLPVTKDAFDFQALLHAGGQMAGDALTAMPLKSDTFLFNRKLRIGGKAGRNVKSPMPCKADSLAFDRTLRIGGRLAVMSTFMVPPAEIFVVYPRPLRMRENLGGAMAFTHRMNVPAEEYIFVYPNRLVSDGRVGGTFDFVAERPIPEKVDDISFAGGVHVGGTFESIGTLRIPRMEDALAFGWAAHTGGTFENIGILPVPRLPEEYNFDRMEYVGRVGGIVERVSRVPVSVADDIHRMDPLDLEMYVGGPKEIQTSMAVPEAGSKLKTRTYRTGGQATRSVSVPIPEIKK